MFFWLLDRMAKKFDSIKDVDGKRETIKLGVKIIDLWFVQNGDGSRHIEMILMDGMVHIFSFVNLIVI